MISSRAGGFAEAKRRRVEAWTRQSADLGFFFGGHSRSGRDPFAKCRSSFGS
jgi:hypothetical protein